MAPLLARGPDDDTPVGEFDGSAGQVDVAVVAHAGAIWHGMALAGTVWHHQSSKLKVEGSSPFARFDDNSRHPVPNRAWAAGYGAWAPMPARRARSRLVPRRATKRPQTRF